MDDKEILLRKKALVTILDFVGKNFMQAKTKVIDKCLIFFRDKILEDSQTCVEISSMLKSRQKKLNSKK